MEKGTYEDREGKEEGREDCPRLQRWRGLRLPPGGAAAAHYYCAQWPGGRAAAEGGRPRLPSIRPPTGAPPPAA